MPPKKKSSLMTPDPYHTPGYAGYVPQFKYDMGQTFGHHTHKLMTSNDHKVASSGNPVLCDIFPGPSSLAASTNQNFTGSPVYDNTTRSWGDQKYVAHMVPGYSGFIPKRQNFFGSRYAESCHTAMCSFEADQHKQRSKREEIRTLTNYQGPWPPSPPGGGGPETSGDPNTPSINTPLRPIRSKAEPYYSTPQQVNSPHYAPDSAPSRYQISGYMGFVPKTQRYLGQGYPIITSKALQEHEMEGRRLARTCLEPVTIVRPPEKPMRTLELYPREMGLIPRYMGHIPGEQFRYGNTFGVSTRETKRCMAATI